MKKILSIISVSFALIISSCSSEKSTSIKALNNHSTILAYGDSLTKGKGVSFANAYPNQLEKMLAIKVVNEGINGEISSKGLKRLPQILAEVKPDLVILCHGGNDLLQKLGTDQLRDNLDKMITLIKQNGADVLLIGVPKPGIFLTPVKLYQRLAEKFDIPLDNEIIANIMAKRSLKSDPAHPNKAGYEKIAQAVRQILVLQKAISP